MNCILTFLKDFVFSSGASFKNSGIVISSISSSLDLKIKK